MAKDKTPKEDSFDEVDEIQEEKTLSEQSDASLGDVLQALRANEAKMEELMAENRALREKNGEADPEDEDNSNRRPAENITLATIDGMPIIDMRLEKNIAKHENGSSYIRNYNAICKVFGQKEDVVISYGEMSEPSDYLNVPRKKFELTNQNSADLTGASKVEHNKIITRGDKVDEIDRSSGVPVRTGKQVELVTRNDIRYYTIKVGDETVELHQDKIYR